MTNNIDLIHTDYNKDQKTDINNIYHVITDNINRNNKQQKQQSPYQNNRQRQLIYTDNNINSISSDNINQSEEDNIKIDLINKTTQTNNNIENENRPYHNRQHRPK